MKAERYLELKERVIEAGYAHEITWAENIAPCCDAADFFGEYAWVVINSGMKEQIARQIWNRIQTRYDDGGKAVDVFGHKAKARAIDAMRSQKESAFERYQSADDKLTFLGRLPWIGPITKYHLAKNLGLSCVKPDRHLTRIAAQYGKSAAELCRDIGSETGDRLTVVDSVLWRAANLGFFKEETDGSH
ncbi:MAG: hypothetical protein LLG97_19505 [Deltaproteobacteria bacterium]|nr:hypothetical protein [Deltaproteobacteria bacterium]